MVCGGQPQRHSQGGKVMWALLGQIAKGKGFLQKIFSCIIFRPRKGSHSFFVLRAQENGYNIIVNGLVTVYSQQADK